MIQVPSGYPTTTTINEVAFLGLHCSTFSTTDSYH